MGELVKLPNIGPELERQLHLIGVDTVEELRRRGSKQAWLAIQKNDPSACFHRLWGRFTGCVKSCCPTR